MVSVFFRISIFNRYADFIYLTKNKGLYNYDYKYYDIATARAIISLINKAQKDYDEFIEHEAEMHAEWQAEIMRGK